jgi:hypothetical protein
MKRYFAVLGVALLFCGSVFSQELRISRGTLSLGGVIHSGVYVDADDVALYDSNGPILSNINAGYYGPEGSIGLWETSTYHLPFRRADDKYHMVTSIFAHYANGPIGFNIRLLSTATGSRDAPYIRYAYGIVNLFDNAVRITGGHIDYDDVWGTGGDLGWSLGGMGVRFEFKPFNLGALRGVARDYNLGALNFGAWIFMPTTKNLDILHDENMNEIIGGGDITVRNVLAETLVGLRWVLPWFYVTGAIKFDGPIDGSEILNYDRTAVWSGAEDEMYATFGSGFTMFPELRVSAEGIFYGLGNWRARGWGEMHQTVHYDFIKFSNPYVAKFYAGLKLREAIWGFDLYEFNRWDFIPDPWIQIMPFAGYKVNNILTTYVEVSYCFGHAFTGDRYLSYENSDVIIKPGLTLNFRNGLEISAWYKYQTIQYGDLARAPAFANRAGSTLPRKPDSTIPVESVTSHQFAIEVQWFF